MIIMVLTMYKWIQHLLQKIPLLPSFQLLTTIVFMQIIFANILASEHPEEADTTKTILPFQNQELALFMNILRQKLNRDFMG